MNQWLQYRLLIRLKGVLLVSLFVLIYPDVMATNYYINGKTGNDLQSGKLKQYAWKTAAPLDHIRLQAGDSVLFAAGQTYTGTVQLINVQGREGHIIYIGSYAADGQTGHAVLDAGQKAVALHIVNSSFIEVAELEITALRPLDSVSLVSKQRMRCGILVELTAKNRMESLSFRKLRVHHIYAMPEGFVRPAGEIQTANGTQAYGWGIRFFNETVSGKITGIRVEQSEIHSVSHTGLKFTSTTGGMERVTISGCYIHDTGGPGLQLSGVNDGHIHHNRIDYSGSPADSRNWARGSGMWTWGCTGILIEHNRFEHANGPGDSAGVHIDFNCRDVVVQYNFSANNAGGFCEILGNNFNCAYRYNVSVNDGFRIKGKNGAFQEGKTFWLSGYRGNKQPKTGPFNSYFYNNTIYTEAGIQPKIAVSSSAEGVLIANNIFYFEQDAIVVAGDQQKAELDTLNAKRVVFSHNLYLRPGNWPASFVLQDKTPLYGDPGFSNKKGSAPADFIPLNNSLISNRGIIIPALPGDSTGLRIGLHPAVDFSGRAVTGLPDIGAFEWRENK